MGQVGRGDTSLLRFAFAGLREPYLDIQTERTFGPRSRLTRFRCARLSEVRIEQADAARRTLLQKHLVC